MENTVNLKSSIAWSDFKLNSDGMVPVIAQDYQTNEVLMLAYMNEEAFLKTKKEGVVTFFSRTKNRLWTKGETSGNYLKVIDITVDCDADTLLITVVAPVATCHTGAKSCFGEAGTKGFIYELEKTISKRIEEKSASSYTNTLYNKGIHKVAQKVGEEAVELVIEAMGGQGFNYDEQHKKIIKRISKEVTIDKVTI